MQVSRNSVAFITGPDGADLGVFGNAALEDQSKERVDSLELHLACSFVFSLSCVAIGSEIERRVGFAGPCLWGFFGYMQAFLLSWRSFFTEGASDSSISHGSSLGRANDADRRKVDWDLRFRVYRACGGCLDGVALSVFTLLDQIGDLDQRYTFSAALLYVGLSVPRLFYETLPYAILIGALISLGGFAVRIELVAMRAAGMSIYKILSYAMLPALLVAGGGVLVGEYVLPDAERMARLERRQATSTANAIAPEYGIWLRDGDAFVHAELIHENTMLGLRWLIFDEGKRLIKVRTAERAQYVPGSDEVASYWELSQIEEVTYDEDRSVRGLGERSTWVTELTPDEISSELLVEPSRMSISTLSKKISVLERQSLEGGSIN